MNTLFLSSIQKWCKWRMWSIEIRPIPLQSMAKISHCHWWEQDWAQESNESRCNILALFYPIQSGGLHSCTKSSPFSSYSYSKPQVLEAFTARLKVLRLVMFMIHSAFYRVASTTPSPTKTLTLLISICFLHTCRVHQFYLYGVVTRHCRARGRHGDIRQK